MILTPDQYQMIEDSSKDPAASEKLTSFIQELLDQLNDCQGRESRYRQMVDNSPYPVFSVNREGLILGCNPATGHFFQLAANRSGLPYKQLAPDDDNPVLASLVELVFAGHTFNEVPVIYRHVDGRQQHMIVRLYPTFDPQRKVSECVFACTDVTERNRFERELRVELERYEALLNTETEQTLRRNEQRFRALFEQTNDAVFLIGLDQNFLAVNQRAADMLGSAPAEFIGITAISYTDPSEIEDAQRRWQLLLSGQSVPVYERTFIHKDGSPIYAEVNLSLMRDAEGQAMYVQSVVRDITARKRAEEALRESENTFRTIIQTMQEGVWILDDTLKTLYVNHSLVDMLGYTHQTMIDSRMPAFLNEENQAAIAPLFDPDTDRIVRHLDVCLARADGSPLWTLVSVTPLLETGHQFGWLVMVTDISQRKHAEAAIQQVSSYNRGLIETSLDPLMTISPEGYITDVNVATERVTGYPRKKLINTDFSSHFTEPERARQAYRRAFDEGNVKDYELAVRHREGRVRPVVFNAAVYRNEEGAVVGVFAAARDISERKRAEETLRQSIAHNQALLNAVPDMILRLSKDGSYLDIKPAMNFSPVRPLEELYKMRVADVLPAQPAQGFMDNIERALATQETQFLEYSLREHGETHIYESRTVPCSADEVISIVRDITERKRVEEHLRDSEERFRAIFESAAIGIAISDASGYRMGVNPTLQKMLGYSFEELYNMSFIQITHPDDLPQELTLIEDLRAGKRDSYQLEKRYCRKDGTYFWVRISASMVHEPGREAQHGLVLVEDITERRQTEAALRESEKRPRLILENMPVMLVAFDQQLRVRFWNRECERVTGYSAEEIIGNPHIFDLLYLDPDERERMLQTWKNSDNNFYDVEMPIRCKDGQIRIISWSSISGEVPIPGWKVWTVGADITERKRAAEKELQLASERERVRILADFIQDAAHEFRTPLSVITTSIYLLEHLDEADSRLNHIHKINQQVKNITKLVESLLTLSRLDTDSNIQLRRMNLNDIVTNAQVALEIPLREKHHTVRQELEADLPKIVGDSQKLHTALVNILYNAVRYTPPKGTITLRTYKNETHIIAEIQDTGIGINQNSLRLIFNRFYREDVAHTTPGFGLGLPIARKIIEQHGGRIEVESTPGEGSIFRVLLPRQRESLPR